MQHQVQLLKKFPIDTIRSHIDSVKGEKISYSLTEKGNFYALDIKYDSLSSYTSFMEKLHTLWRDIREKK